MKKGWLGIVGREKGMCRNSSLKLEIQLVGAQPEWEARTGSGEHCGPFQRFGILSYEQQEVTVGFKQWNAMIRFVLG